MKVLVIGGAGVFGSRLARLLVRDGHSVTLGGRNLAKAQELATELDCAAAALDLGGDLSGVAEFDVVVDAAGPYHAYGDDPYRLAKTAIRAGVHYLDFSDNAPFSQGIAQLDQDARRAGVCVLSGMSSVPALSCAVVRSLIGDAVPDHIDVAILPGNRSPRGLSVMASILTQVGRPMQVFRGGRWSSVFGWSEPKCYDLPGGLQRQGWIIEVPDVALFPDHFGAKTVIFRAGLELWLMRYGLWLFGLLRRAIPVPITNGLLRGFKLAADLLAPFGSDQGGMSVTVRMGREQTWWRLRVEAGDGPFIPTISIRALLRRKTLPIGAGPALESITLAEAEAAMSDLNAQSERGKEPLHALFPRVLGKDFDALPPHVRATHETYDIGRWQGQASVRRGSSMWSKALTMLFQFPPATDRIAVEVTKTVTAHGETWERNFGGHRFRSHLKATPQGMTERFGPFTFCLGLKVEEGSLHFPVLSARLGPLPLPKWLLPVSIAREYEADDQFHFDVKLLAPITHRLLVHYRGQLSEAPPDPR
ncbi:DUF4166 domain-containing protein [Epibacterium sp. SM1979]|uniref:DUF4166 domain-containing protein n=1 Tax=Tritonibacter litoralis TaxID=2662264 RepID=A0A843YIP8_9RHOB|nr:SDR family oxidoreductase [Tritonibacter litoralis]MQQ09678.1 DUF4166 domain-containing protein [Tritonibacter litoralis]